jgi:4-aminobutyrate aminotransferase
LRSQPHLSSLILDVRGKGLMVGLEFASPSYSPRDVGYNSKAPAGLAAKVTKKCLEKGMLLLTTSVFEVVRFIPPLNLSEGEMKEGCDIFKASVEEVAKESR